VINADHTNSRDHAFRKDPMPTRLPDQALVGNRELKIRALDVGEEAYEPLGDQSEHDADETRVRASDHLLLLPSCHIPSLRQVETGTQLPAAFNGETSAENSARVGFKEFFCDPLLTGLIDQALAGNQDLRILNEDVNIAGNDILARQGAYLPFVSVGAGASIGANSLYTPLGAVEKRFEYFPGKHFPDPLPDVSLGADLSWRVDIWRELRNARDAAILRTLSTAERRNYAVTRLIADIAENYFQLLALDKRMEILDQTIQLQENSLKVAEANKAAARGTELGVQRFLAEVRRNQSEKLIVRQEIIEVENRINYLVGRFPQPVERQSTDFVNLALPPIQVGVPAQLLQNRPDIRQAERELQAAGLDILVARARFFPRLDISGRVGYEAFNPKYLFNTPEALVYNIAGELVAPLINKKAIQADYLNANARQLQAIYNYQRVVINAFTEVVNRITMVENYSKSIEIKKQQLTSLETSVRVAYNLFQNARAEYVDVLFANRDLMAARMDLVQTKHQQLSAIANAYQALGGGDLSALFPPPGPPVVPHGHH
jgi:NodT family efflux transporter outer membrane factor (OMF) lipoprotein